MSEEHDSKLIKITNKLKVSQSQYFRNKIEEEKI